MKLHYLGPAGTFSEAAARGFLASLDADADLEPVPSIRGVVDATAKEGGLGVVPYYNLIDGLVQESLDRILVTGLEIRGGYQLPIRMAFGGADGAADDAPVFSHPKALAQCSEFLDAQHPDRPRIAVSSTAEGVKRAAAEAGMALAGRATFESLGVAVLEEDAANRYFGRRNYTEFLLIGRRGDDLPRFATAPDRCVLAAAPQSDRPGLLADILGLLSLFDINLARLHSRPAIAAAPTQLDPQVFYLEIAGVLSERVMKICAESLALTLGGEEAVDVLFNMGEYPLTALPPE